MICGASIVSSLFSHTRAAKRDNKRNKQNVSFSHSPFLPRSLITFSLFCVFLSFALSLLMSRRRKACMLALSLSLFHHFLNTNKKPTINGTCLRITFSFLFSPFFSLQFFCLFAENSHFPAAYNHCKL